MDLIDIFVIAVAAYLIMRAVTFTRSVYDAQVEAKLKNTIMVKVDRIVDQLGKDMYLVHKVDSNEFVMQCNSMEDILPALRKKFNDFSIFVATEDLSLMALFITEEAKK